MSFEVGSEPKGVIEFEHRLDELSIYDHSLKANFKSIVNAHFIG